MTTQNGSGYVSEYKSCGVRSIDVESTELNTEKGLKIKHFRELEVFFRLSDFSL